MLDAVGGLQGGYLEACVTCEPRPDLRGILTPANMDRIVSHYRILEYVGMGGMGEVYAGLDETLMRKVALKAIRSDQRLSAPAKARFLREARLLSQLDHPNVCRVYDYIEEDQGDWLVLEFVDGTSLGTALRTAWTHPRSWPSPNRSLGPWWRRIPPTSFIEI